MLISSKIHIVACLKCYYYINVLITLFALSFQNFWKMKLGEIFVYSYISFLCPFLYKGFIRENLNLSGQIPLIKTLLHISLRGELMES